MITVGIPPAQNVTIEMTSTFAIQMAPPDSHKAVYTGQLHYMNGTWYIKYAEEQEEGKTKATLKIKDGEVSVIRNGAISMRHSYRPGVKTSGFYTGPAGRMQMDTETYKLELGRDEDGFLSSAAWVYDLYLNEQKIGRYTIACSLQRL